MKSLHIRNFQSLVKADLQLGTLTVIVGQNDLGKSASFRAVRSAVEAAAGSDFITHGAPYSTVALVDEDGNRIVWQKGPKTNRYVLFDRDGTQIQQWEKVGRETPPELAKLLAMGPVEYDKDLKLNTNFADQDDPPFLIPYPGGLSTSQVAKILGDLTNLNVLYKAVAEADRQRVTAERDARFVEAELDEARRNLAATGDLESETRELERLRLLVASARAALLTVERLKEHATTRDELRSRHDQLARAVAGLGPSISTDEVEALASRVSLLQEAQAKLRQLRTDATAHEEQAAEYARQIPQAAAELTDYLKQLGHCPLCMQPVGTSENHTHATA